MRGFNFSKYNPNENSKSPFEKLLDLFLQLLTYTNGDFNEAMQWLNELDKEYKLTTPDYGIGDFLEDLNTPMYKIASLETGDHRLIKAVAETGKPLIISTGATEWKEIEELVEVVEKAGNRDLTLLVCTSSYPSDPADAHLLRIETLRNRFGVKVGLSDHTLGIGVSVAAIALGASVIEKHLTLRRSDGGADGAFSMEPEEFRQMVEY